MLPVRRHNHREVNEWMVHLRRMTETGAGAKETAGPLARYGLECYILGHNPF